MPKSDWTTDTGTPVTVIETGLYIDGEYLEDTPPDPDPTIDTAGGGQDPAPPSAPEEDVEQLEDPAEPATTTTEQEPQNE